MTAREGSAPQTPPGAGLQEQQDRQRGRPDSSRRRQLRGGRRCPAPPTPPQTAPVAPPREGCGERASGLPITANTARPARYRRDLRGCGGSAPSSPPRHGRGALTVPGRAHELVQHGAHLGLRRHLERGGSRRGPAESRRQRPTRPEARRALGPAPRVTGGAAPPRPREEGGSGPAPAWLSRWEAERESRLAPDPVPPPRAPTRSLTPAPSRARHARAPAGTETCAHAPCAPSSAPRRQRGRASALAHWPRPAPLGQ